MLSAVTVKCLFFHVGLPTITDVSDDQVTLAGNNVSLSCSATGNPLPSIRWRRDGILDNHHSIVTSSVSSSSVTSTLNLFAVTSQDSGPYYCDAVIGLGTPPFEQMLLTVQGKEINFSEDFNMQYTYLTFCLSLSAMEVDNTIFQLQMQVYSGNIYTC